MYAIIATGGKQYKVAEGDVIKIEKVYFDFLGKINAGCKYEMYEPKILI